MGNTSEKCEKGKDPKKCTPEQVKECHGAVGGHPCPTTPEKKAK